MAQQAALESVQALVCSVPLASEQQAVFSLTAVLVVLASPAWTATAQTTKDNVRRSFFILRDSYTRLLEFFN
jgi:hypothetical protein